MASDKCSFPNDFSEVLWNLLFSLSLLLLWLELRLLSFLNLSFLLRSSLVVLLVEVVGSLSAHSPRCRCYFRLLYRSVDRILC